MIDSAPLGSYSALIYQSTYEIEFLIDVHVIGNVAIGHFEVFYVDNYLDPGIISGIGSRMQLHGAIWPCSSSSCDIYMFENVVLPQAQAVSVGVKDRPDGVPPDRVLPLTPSRTSGCITPVVASGGDAWRCRRSELHHMRHTIRYRLILEGKVVRTDKIRPK